jgi:hypothetical protein
MGFVVYRQGLGLVVRDEGYAAEGRRKGGGEGGDGAEVRAWKESLGRESETRACRPMEEYM